MFGLNAVIAVPHPDVIQARYGCQCNANGALFDWGPPGITSLAPQTTPKSTNLHTVQAHSNIATQPVDVEHLHPVHFHWTVNNISWKYK